MILNYPEKIKGYSKFPLTQQGNMPDHTLENKKQSTGMVPAHNNHYINICEIKILCCAFEVEVLGLQVFMGIFSDCHIFSNENGRWDFYIDL